MKRFLVGLCLALWATPAFAQGIKLTNTAPFFNEKFERTGGDTTDEDRFSVSVDTGSSIDGNGDPSALSPPTSWGSEALHVTRQDDNDQAYFTFFSTDRTFPSLPCTHVCYFRLEFYVAAETLDDTEKTRLMRITDAANSNTVIDFEINQTSGQLTFLMAVLANGSSNTNDTIAISTGTFYVAEAKYDIDSAVFEWKMDGVSQGTTSLTGSFKRDVNRIAGIGAATQSAGGAEYWIDNVAVSTQDWIGSGGNSW